MSTTLGSVELLLAVKNKLKEHTEMAVYDTVPPDNAPSPLIFVEMTGSTLDHRKLVYKERYNFNIHHITAENAPNATIYEVLDKIRAWLEEEVALPDYATLIQQITTGIQVVKKEETDEWHGIIGFDLVVAYYLSK